MSKIWQIEIGNDEDGENLEVINGIAENADEAIERAMEFAKEEGGYKKPYPSRVTEIGEQVF